jgi:hypothetical protein
MLPRKASPVATTIEVTITVARTTVVATSEARKIAEARRAALSLVDQRSAALIIARRKLPVPPHPALQRKNPFFFPASLLPSIVESLQLRRRLPLPSRKFTNRNPTSKTQRLALPAT